MTPESVMAMGTEAMKIALMLAAPLLLAAAFVEAYVTPAVAAWFL